MLSSITDSKKITPDIIHGFVLDQYTREPLLWVNVKLENSDEQSLTNDNGEFKIISWKRFPVSLEFEHEGFEPVHLRVTCIKERLVIMMKSKCY